MMLSLALSMAVMTSSGGLLSEHLPAGVRLLDAPSVVPSAMLGRIRDRDRDRDRDDGLSRAELQSMSLQQLHEEYDRLEDEKPGIGLGLTLTIVGGAVLLTSFFFWYGWWYVGLIMTLPAIALCIIGPILLAKAIRARHRYNRDQDAIDRQIRVLESGGQGGAVPPGPTPPPPPPPPPMGGLTAVPQVVVASF